MTESNAAGHVSQTSFRKKIRRTRTGCLTCRERRVKCDEAQPECDNCRNRGRTCRRGPHARSVDAPPPTSPGRPLRHHPPSPSPTRSRSDGPHAAAATSDTASQLAGEETRPLARDHSELIQHYIAHCAPWFDATDAHSHFSISRAHQMMHSRPWRMSALALASRHRHLHKLEAPYSASLELYQDAVHHVISSISTGPAEETVLAGCLLLAVYEMMAFKYEDWNRHINGCASMLMTNSWNGSHGGLVAGCFWAYARIDIWAAFCNGRSTIVPTSQWVDDADAVSNKLDLEPSDHANIVVWLFGQIVNLRSQAQKGVRDCDVAEWHKLWAQIRRWPDAGVQASKPLLTLDMERDADHPFPQILFLGHASALGYTMYHTGMVLMLELGLELSALERISEQTHHHSLQACGIVQTNPHSPSLVNAIQPVWICGRHLRTRSERFAALELLALIEDVTGWTCSWRSQDLRQQWGIK